MPAAVIAERPSWPTLTAVLIGALALRLVFFGGLRGWDDIHYLAAAASFRDGDFTPRSTFHLRYGFVVPLALGQALFGESERAVAVVPLLFSLAAIAITYALGLAYGGRRVAFGSAALLAVLPLDVVGASDLHTDLASGAFMAAAVYAVLRADATPPLRRGWAVACGVCVGLAYLTKETGLVVLLFLALRAWRRSTVSLPWVAAGLVAVLAMQIAWFAWLTGNPLFAQPPEAAQMHFRMMTAQPAGYDWLLGYPRMLLDPSAAYFGYFAGIGYLLAAATIWGLRRGDASIRELTLWWGSVLVVFNIAPLDRTFTHPLFVHFARTLHPLLIPFSVVAARWLVDGLALRPRLRAGIVTAVVVLALVGMTTMSADHRSWAEVARQAAAVVARESADVSIAADPANAALLRIVLPERRGRVAEVDTWRGEPPALLLDDAVFGRSYARSREAIAALRASASYVPLAEIRRPAREGLRGRLRRLLGRGDRAGLPTEPAATLWRRVP